MMIVLKTNDEMINELFTDSKRKPKPLQFPFQNNEKRTMTIYKTEPSSSNISNPVEVLNDDVVANPKIRVLKIEN